METVTPLKTERWGGELGKAKTGRADVIFNNSIFFSFSYNSHPVMHASYQLVLLNTNYHKFQTSSGKGIV